MPFHNSAGALMLSLLLITAASAPAQTSTSKYQHASRKSYIIESNRKGWCWTVRAKVGGRWGDWSEVRCFEAEPVNTDCP